MAIRLIQPSFAGGELSPDAQARVDFDKYRTGAKTLRNFLISQKGTPFNRPGTEFMGAAKFANKKSRLIPFVFATDQAYMLEFGDQYIRFYKKEGEVLEDANNSEIPFWDTTQTYSLNDYVLFTRTDFKIVLYKSLKFANMAKNPETATTYWQTITEVRNISAGTFGVGEYCYAIRPTDGKRKIFISITGVATDPFSPPNQWLESAPAVYSSSTTYAIGNYVSLTDISGNVSIYRSLRNNNTNHDYLTETLWWALWDSHLAWDNGTTYIINDFTLRVNSGVTKSYVSLVNGNIGNDPLVSSQAYWLEFDALRIYEIATPYAYQDVPLLKIAQSADTLYITHKDYAPRVLTRTSDNNWTLALYDFQFGPFRLSNTDDTQIMKVNQSKQLVAVGFDYFNSSMVGNLFRLGYDVQASSVVSMMSGPSGVNGSFTQAITCGGTWRLVTSGTWTGTISLVMSVDGGTTWTLIQSFTSHDDTNFNTFGTVDNGGDPFLVRIYSPAPYLSIPENAPKYLQSGIVNVALKSDAFTQTGYCKTTGFVDARTMTVTEIKNINEDSTSSDWAEGAWSDYRGWPATVAFAQDRLVFGGNNSESQTEWFTKSSAYVDFGRSNPLVDSDGITINLLSRQVNRIRSLVSFLNSLIAFTGSTEFSTDGLSDGPLTPTNVFTKVQGVRGSGDVDPVIVGNDIIFISPFSSSVRSMVFNIFSQSFATQNISSVSDHLIADSPIVSMAYQQEPNSVIWMVREDGVLLSLTYLKEQELLSWTRHDTKDGLFESVAVIPGTDTFEVWFVVKRGDLRFVERMLKRTSSTDPADQYFVDCGLTYDGTPVTSLSGLDHLNGQQVTINAEGFVLPLQTVSNGTITLDKARSKVIAGLPITADLELLNPDWTSRDGTVQGIRYHLSACEIRFLNSRGGTIGMDVSTLQQIIDERDPSLAATTPTPLLTGYTENRLTIPQGDDPRGHLFFRQTDPMPVHILSITQVLDPGDQS